MKKTVLNPVHRDLQARLVEFGGFEMPVQYDSIVEEHHAVRRGAGLFDLCHMGRYEIRGENAVAAVDGLVTCNVAKQKDGQIRYALVPNESGGVMDDILVYRLPDRVLLVVNAGNRDKLLPYFTDRIAAAGATFEDRSEQLAMIAVQGPKADGLLAPLVATTWVPDLASLGYYKISDVVVEAAGKSFSGWVSRTGYTGENGFELYVDADQGIDLWEALRSACGDELLPCGLGARDTLRLEAGMPLYGHELGEDINPYEAGLGFAVKLKKPNGFVGVEKLRAVKESGPQRVLRGFSVEGRRVARQGMTVLLGDEAVGEVTSGAPSPTLEKNIALAFVRADVPEDAALEVDVRGKRASIKPHTVPFYERTES